MKKLFTLIGALLLWQSVAVAQNYLHIWTGDSTKIVPMAQLDSVTVRDVEFYKLDLSKVDGLRFTGDVADYYGNDVYTFDVTLAQGEGTTVYIRNLDPYFAQYGYTAENGCNTLEGELVVAEDGSSATITCQLGQPMGYDDAMFYNPFGGATIDFTLTEATMACTTGFGVYTESQGGWYTVFNPFTLNKVAGTAAPARKAKAMEPKPLKSMKQLKPMAAPQETATKEASVKAQQLMPCPEDVTID